MKWKYLIVCHKCRCEQWRQWSPFLPFRCAERCALSVWQTINVYDLLSLCCIFLSPCSSSQQALWYNWMIIIMMMMLKMNVGVAVICFLWHFDDLTHKKATIYTNTKCVWLLNFSSKINDKGHPESKIRRRFMAFHYQWLSLFSSNNRYYYVLFSLVSSKFFWWEISVFCTMNTVFLVRFRLKAVEW